MLISTYLYCLSCKYSEKENAIQVTHHIIGEVVTIKSPFLSFVHPFLPLLHTCNYFSIKQYYSNSLYCPINPSI